MFFRIGTAPEHNKAYKEYKKQPEPKPFTIILSGWDMDNIVEPVSKEKIRQIESKNKIRVNRPDHYHLCVASELAAQRVLSQYLGLETVVSEGNARYDLVDVFSDQCFQVRGTDHASGELAIKPQSHIVEFGGLGNTSKDTLSDRFILVTAQSKDRRIWWCPGWAFGFDVIPVSDRLYGPNNWPKYMPQCYLRPLEELITAGIYGVAS